MNALATLAAVQTGRAAAFPEKIADNPVRAAVLNFLQQRNAALDAVFYDVGAVTAAEAPDVAFWLAREGAILLVPPTQQGQLRVFLRPAEFFDAAGPVAALAVAGVGSSALGAAAFARNVADALQRPVAAVVSGYGLADILTEALGGYFLFGALNSVRHAFEPLDTLTKVLTRTEHSLAGSDGVAWTRTSRDTETVIALLRDERFTASLLIGHSKGNLVISEALYAIALESESAAKALAERCRIVTLSAKIGMPRHFHRVLDVIGEWDWFGRLNSRPDIRSDYVVPHAWHSTNPEFPFAMGIDVTDTLKKVLPMLDARAAHERQLNTPPLADVPQIMTAALRAHGPPTFSALAEALPVAIAAARSTGRGRRVRAARAESASPR
jgi:hypothetical protein